MATGSVRPKKTAEGFQKRRRQKAEPRPEVFLKGVASFQYNPAGLMTLRSVVQIDPRYHLLFA